VDCEKPSVVGRWPLLRVRPGHQFEFELLSGEWVRLCTHFCTKTFLCAEDDRCEACSVLPARNYWYLPGLAGPEKRPSLIELSASASADLEQRAKFSFGSIGAGLTVVCSRKGPRSPVLCEPLRFAARATPLPFQTWVTYLMAIYNLPAVRPIDSLESYSVRVLPMVLERANLMAARARGLAERGVRGR
jgi:hypothetical protein